MTPPRSSSPTSLACRHQRPRAQRTTPARTNGVHSRRPFRCSGRAYFRTSRTGPNCWQRRPQSLVGRTRAHNSRSSGGRSRASPLAEMSSTHPSCSHCTGPGFRELRRTTSSSAYRASTRGIGQDFLGRVVFSGDTEEREEFTAGSCGPAGLKNLVQTFYAWGCPVAYAAPVEPEHSAH